MNIQSNDEPTETVDPLLRGALPLTWFVLIGCTVLLYALPASDPVWGGMITTLRQWQAPLPAFILLAILTFLLGFPCKKELIAATAVGIVVSAALVALTGLLADHLVAWFIVVYFVVVPLSGFLFHRLNGKSVPRT